MILIFCSKRHKLIEKCKLNAFMHAFHLKNVNNYNDTYSFIIFNKYKEKSGFIVFCCKCIESQYKILSIDNK